MDAHLSAALENTPDREGSDIQHAPAGYLARSGGMIVRAVEVHHMNIRSAGLRTSWMSAPQRRAHSASESGIFSRIPIR